MTTEESKTTLDDLKLGFLSHKRMEENEDVYQGAILITDGGCKPLEFRCTSPVRPNAVQKTLYGRTLVPHIATDLMALPLLKAIQEKPDIVLINDTVFLEIRPKADVPILHLRRQGEAIQFEDSREREDTRESVLVESASGRFQPIVMIPHWNYPDDLNEHRAKIREAFAYADLLEPFNRVYVALDEVYKQDPIGS
ncbi:MAG: hypothetical protein RX316_00010 [bacterium]|nr:hypothetical protein [bacterium]